VQTEQMCPQWPNPLQVTRPAGMHGTSSSPNQTTKEFSQCEDDSCEERAGSSAG
jgi:hypothetical protein